MSYSQEAKALQLMEAESISEVSRRDYHIYMLVLVAGCGPAEPTPMSLTPTDIPPAEAPPPAPESARETEKNTADRKVFKWYLRE